MSFVNILLPCLHFKQEGAVYRMSSGCVDNFWAVYHFDRHTQLLIYPSSIETWNLTL